MQQIKTDLEMPSDMPARIYMIMDFYKGMTPLQMPRRNSITVTLLYTSTVFSELTSILLWVIMICVTKRWV